MAGEFWLHPWDIPRWRNSKIRRHCTSVERYIYRELCDECYSEGYIPEDLTQQAAIAGVSIEEMKATWPALSRKFFRSHGRLRNATADAMRAAAEKRRQKAALSGSMGGKEKWRRIKELYSSATSDATSDGIARASGSFSPSGAEMKNSNPKTTPDNGNQVFAGLGFDTLDQPTNEFGQF